MYVINNCTNLVLSSIVFRPLPSLESPQLDFLTPTEEIAVPLTQEDIPPLQQATEKITEIPSIIYVKKPVDLPEPLKKLSELLEPTHQTTEPTELPQGTKVELTEDTGKVEISGPAKKEEETLEELPEPKKGPDTYSEVLQEPAELQEPPESTENLPELTTKETWFPVLPKTEEPGPTEPLEPKERKLICEELVNPVEVPPEEPFHASAEETTVTETGLGAAENLQDSG